MIGRATLIPAALAAPMLAVSLLAAQPQDFRPYQYPQEIRPARQPWEWQPGGEEGYTVPVYRLNNPRTGEHRYTSDPGELNGWLSSGQFENEGVVFRLLPEVGPNLTPLFRLTLPNGSSCLAVMTVPGYKDPRGPIADTLGYCSIKRYGGWQSLYEWYNPRRGLWLYLTDPSSETAAENGYRFGRRVAYVLPAS